MRDPANPFILTGYHSPSYFCDRQEEFAWLKEQLSNERNMVIYSWRRLGKTALVRHFFHHLEKKKQAEGVFIDLMGTQDLNEATKRVVSAIIHRFGDLKKDVKPGILKLLGSLGATVGFDPLSGTPQVTLGMMPPRSTKMTFEALGGFLSERKKPVVLCIDEFQQVVHYHEKQGETLFRTWMQDFPMIRFIFSGSHRQMMTSMFSERSRPFYRSAQLLELKSLPAGVYATFIRSLFQRAGKQIDNSRIDRIFKWSRMQTYYVQLVCNKLFGKSENVTDALLDETLAEVLQQESPLFSSYQQLLTSFQWKLLISMAREEKVRNPLGKDFLGKHGLGAASSVDAALKALINKEFIIREEKDYKLHDTLLMRWLQQL